MSRTTRPNEIQSTPLYAVGILFAAACTAIIGLTAARLADFEIIGVTQPFQYPWRLKEPTVASQLSAWFGYAAHNLIAWCIIAYARKTAKGFTRELRGFNWYMFAVHLFFIGLHIAQTHLFYDALARDVPEVTALGSVALMLMVILILETPRRGLFLGKRFPFHKRFLKVVREYHGYLFTWALIYTFWYHPTEATSGHLVGFFYMFLLLWQSVLLFHRAHLNKGWIIFLEVMVIPHGVLVAYFQGNALWPMFGFGFGAMFVLTQMYAFRWSKQTYGAVYALFLILLVAGYVSADQLEQWHSVFRIPVLDYAVVFLLYGLFWCLYLPFHRRNNSD
jgi:uncharacterized membrane protein YhdT